MSARRLFGIILFTAAVVAATIQIVATEEPSATLIYACVWLASAGSALIVVDK